MSDCEFPYGLFSSEQLRAAIADESSYAAPPAAGAIRLVIHGAPRTKKTSQQIAMKQDGTPFIVSSSPGKAWAKEAARQLREAWAGRPPIEGPIHVRALIYRERATGDLAGYIQAIGDVLEVPRKKAKKSTRDRKASVIRDDNQIDSWDGSRRLKDKDNPRVELEITPL